MDDSTRQGQFLEQDDPCCRLFEVLWFYLTDPGEPGIDLSHSSLRHLLAHRRQATHLFVDPEIEQRHEQVLAVTGLVV